MYSYAVESRWLEPLYQDDFDNSNSYIWWKVDLKRVHSPNADENEANFNPFWIWANLDHTVIYNKTNVKSTWQHTLASRNSSQEIWLFFFINIEPNELGNHNKWGYSFVSQRGNIVFKITQYWAPKTKQFGENTHSTGGR